LPVVAETVLQRSRHGDVVKGVVVTRSLGCSQRHLIRGFSPKGTSPKGTLAKGTLAGARKEAPKRQRGPAFNCGEASSKSPARAVDFGQGPWQTPDSIRCRATSDALGRRTDAAARPCRNGTLEGGEGPLKGAFPMGASCPRRAWHLCPEKAPWWMNVQNLHLIRCMRRINSESSASEASRSCSASPRRRTRASRSRHSERWRTCASRGTSRTGPRGGREPTTI